MAAQVHHLTPEQMAAYQAIPFGQMAYHAAAAGAAEGLHGGAGGLTAVPSGAPIAFPAPLDPAILAQHMASAAATPFPIPLPAAPHSAGGSGAQRNDGPNPRNDRHFWKEAEQQELLRLVADQAYRQSILGAPLPRPGSLL